MRKSDLFSLCLQNLLRRKSRTALTGLGVVIGCGIGALRCDSWKGVVDSIPQILKLGVTVGAVMELIPRITALFIEGLKPICDSIRAIPGEVFYPLASLGAPFRVMLWEVLLPASLPKALLSFIPTWAAAWASCWN